MPDFLKALGIEEEIVISLPTELMTTNCINRRMDYCGLSRNHDIIKLPTELMTTNCINRRMDYCGLSRNHDIINVEFQSSVLTKEDEIRIFDYASSLFVKHKLPVKTYIISTAEDKSRKT